MGLPVERQNHSFAFFVLGTLVLVCTAWSFWDEFLQRRPWKEYQRENSRFQREKAERDVAYFKKLEKDERLTVVLDPSKPEETLSLAEARKRLGLAEEALARKRGEVASLEKAEAAARLELDEAEQEVRNLKSEADALFFQRQKAFQEEALDRQRSRTLSARGDGPQAAAAASRADRHLASLAAIEKERERNRQAIASAEARVRTAGDVWEKARHPLELLTEGPRKLRSAIDAALDPLAVAEAAVATARAQGTGLSQYWLTAYDGSVDRCGSCHSNIDRCGFSRPREILVALAQPGAEEASVLPRYCVTPDVVASYRATAEQLCAARLGAGSPSGRCLAEAEVEQLSRTVAAFCGEGGVAAAGLAGGARACGASEEVERLLSAARAAQFSLPVWALTHPHRSELMGANHPPELFGCALCHEGQGAQTKGVANREFAHGWDDPFWERPMLDLVAHKKFRPTGWGPPGPGEVIGGTWEKRQRHFIESSCAKCHPDEVRLAFAPTYSAGRRLAAEAGCHGCHVIDAFAGDPKIGPSLTALRSKTRPSFLLSWLSNPRETLPHTRMPNFWPEALDHAGALRVGSSELQARAREVRAIAAFLWKSSTPGDLPPPPVAGRSDRGRLLAQQLGCRGCHNLSPVEKFCSEEDRLAGKSRGTAAAPGECETPRNLSASARRDFAPNLSGIGHRANAGWLFRWLKNPANTSSGARMPNLRLSDAEAADLAAYLATLKSGPAPTELQAAWDEGSTEFAVWAEEGSRLVALYGCAGCHEIRGHENDAKVGPDLNTFGQRPASLLDFGNAIPNPRHRTWYNWVDLKLRAPRAFRYERVDTRMPQYDHDDAEVVALMTFLRSRTGERVPAAFSLRTSERLTAKARGEQTLERYNCRGCHAVDGEGGEIRDVYTEDDLYKAPPPLQKEGFRVQPQWLLSFLRDPSRTMRPWLEARMPTFALSDGELDSAVKGFTAAAGVSYPFVTVQATRATGAEAAEVDDMVALFQCFSCHTLGAPRADPSMASLAPDLQLSKKRLRPEWVTEWIRNPQALQDGTRMPAFFAPDQPETVMYPQFLGGSQARQIQALSDWVMTLPDGAKPPILKPPPTAK